MKYKNLIIKFDILLLFVANLSICCSEKDISFNMKTTNPTNGNKSEQSIQEVSSNNSSNNSRNVLPEDIACLHLYQTWGGNIYVNSFLRDPNNMIESYAEGSFFSSFYYIFANSPVLHGNPYMDNEGDVFYDFTDKFEPDNEGYVFYDCYEHLYDYATRTKKFKTFVNLFDEYLKLRGDDVFCYAPSVDKNNPNKEKEVNNCIGKLYREVKESIYTCFNDENLAKKVTSQKLYSGSKVGSFRKLLNKDNINTNKNSEIIFHPKEWVGKKYKDNGIFSMSKNKYIAIEFGINKKLNSSSENLGCEPTNDNDICLFILDKASKVVCIDIPNPNKNFSDEKEVMIKPGTEFIIKDLKIKTKTINFYEKFHRNSAKTDTYNIYCLKLEPVIE